MENIKRIKLDKCMEKISSIKMNLIKRKTYNTFRINKLETYTFLSDIKRSIRNNYEFIGVLNPEDLNIDKDKLLYISKNLENISDVLKSVANRLPILEEE